MQPERQKRVLLVGLRWPAETFLARKIEWLGRLGLRVIVAAKVENAGVPLPDGAELLPLPQWGSRPLGRAASIGLQLVAAFFRSPRGLARTLRTVARQASGARETMLWLHRLLPFSGRQADVVHFEWNFAAAEFLPLAPMLGAPSVVSCRGAHIQVAPLNPARKGYVDGLRRSFEQAAAVHCVSEAIREAAVPYGLDRAKAVIIRPAVDPEFFTPAAAAPYGPFRVVSNGSIIWRKGYEYALLAIRELAGRGIDVIYEIIGDGVKSEQQRLRYTIADLGLEGRVVLHGRLAATAVRERLRASHAHLLASLSEGISNAVLEAMACGVAVVTSDCGGMAEAVRDGVDGFVVPVRDPQRMAARLEQLAGDADLRARMGASARRRIEEQFSLRQQAEAFRTLYAGLEGRGAAGARRCA